MKTTRLSMPAHRRPNTPFRALRAIAALSILSGPIYAQIPGLPITRTWDDGAADGLFGNAVNWSADTLPGVNDIANLNNTTGALTVNLGAASYDIGALLFSANSATQHILNNGTIITSSISQTADDPNALDPTALVMTKSAGADVLRVNVSANTLQLQGKVTSGGLSKFGGNVLRLGTSGTAFDNAINGSVVIYGGTLQASAGNVPGVNNPLGGIGNVTIGAPGVTLSLTHSNLAAAGAAGTYDFVRDVVANNNSFTLNADRAAGLATSGTSLIGTVTMGNATLTSTIGNGYTMAMDSLNMVAGSTNTRVQINGLLRVDGLVGDASSNLYKRGGTDLEIRGSSEASFSGDIFHAEANLRLQSMGAGLNPAGGSDSTIFFANGYGLAAIDGGQTLQLRSDLALDYGSNIAFRPGVTIGRIDVNRVGTTATAQRLTVGDVNLSGQLLRVLGGNTFSLGIDNIIVAPGSAQIFDGNSADSIVTGNLTLGTGTTFTKIGGSALTLSSNNAATIQGTIIHRQGNLIGSVAGSLGPNPIEVGDPAVGTDGFQNRVSRLQVNHADAITNATGTDATAKLGGIIDINATPNGDDIYAIQAGGMLQGNTTQLGVLTYNVTALLSTDAIILHEQPGAATGTVIGLPANASTFYGIAVNATTLPNMGPGTPWKGISTDNTARTVQGVDAVTPAILNVEGGDNDANTIEVRLNGLNNVNLNLGTTTAADGEFKWNSVTTQKVTVELTGAQGLNTLGLVKGGRIAFNELNSVSGLSTHVDKIIVSGSSLILPIVGTQGGVPSTSW